MGICSVAFEFLIQLTGEIFVMCSRLRYRPLQRRVLICTPQPIPAKVSSVRGWRIEVVTRNYISSSDCRISGRFLFAHIKRIHNFDDR